MNTKRIIVGYDFSDNSKHALQIALNMAEAFDGQVHLVTALPGHLDPKVLKAALDKASPRHDQLYAVEALIESMEGRVRETTASLNNLSRMTSIDVMQIRAPEAITEVADMREADLIVLGATGLGSLERLMLGSTSQRLVHTSRWPVLVVKPELMWPPQRVVCAVDFSDASANAVELG
ncbi:MAG: universal stress protein, partial [Myxococcota bacterium]